MFLPLLLGALAYGEYQRKRGVNKGKKSSASTTNTSSEKSAIQKQNIYNYNGLTAGNMGTTLFQGGDLNQPQSRRAIFG